jgi:hypothetical protein
MTLFGKILVYLGVVASLIAVAVSTWLVIARKDWDGERRALNEEIHRRNTLKAHEENALRALLYELSRGDRTMPWDMESPDGSAGGKTVVQIRKDIRDLQKENETLFDQVNQLEVTHTTLLDDLKKQRNETQLALEEQKRLRETITPDPGSGRKPFRELIAEYRAGRDAAEEEIERVKPDLANETVKVSLLLKRHEALTKRLEELSRGGKSSARLARP